MHAVAVQAAQHVVDLRRRALAQVGEDVAVCVLDA